MANVHKLNSTVKTIELAKVTMITNQTVAEHGIVFVGDRCGIILDKINDNEITVDFNRQKDFTCKLFDESNLPNLGEKIYIEPSTGKLTKTESGNKLVGYFWKKMGGAVIFSLA